ncbi:glycosyltransferase family 2 protein [Undibacterium arcticum]
MRISCSVVCYNNAPTQIAQVLQSVATSSIAVFVYVIDNSHDDRLAAVAKEFGAVYIHLPHNPGFGAAHNVAIRGALEKWIDISFGVESRYPFFFGRRYTDPSRLYGAA